MRGVDIEAQSRCAHYRSPLEVIAIKLPCCGEYFACSECHDALADRALEQWPPSAWDETAVLCGICKSQLAITKYLEDPTRCPVCEAAFNPACRDHHGRYFSGQ